MITVYQYDSLGVYSGKIDIDPEDALPPNSTSLAPPKTTGNKVAQWAGGVWVVLAGPPSPPTPDWPSLIASRRYTAEMAGTVIQGMVIATDDRSQGLITGAALAAMLDADYTIKWKTAEGFVELTGAQIIGVASAVHAYVQACFDREADLLTAVADGSITEAMLDEGWPA
jgi:hypothetical protein